MSLTHEELRTETVRSIALVLEIEAANIQMSDRIREDLGMDSLGSLELLSVLSDALRIDLEIDEAMGIETVADACAFVERSYTLQQAAPRPDPRPRTAHG